jgi:membrane fusion protein (multidrug efflux system)
MENTTEIDIKPLDSSAHRPAGKAQKKSSGPALKVIGVAALLACAAGTYFYLNSPWESTDDAYVSGHIVPVSPKVAGHVAKVYITDNQQVKEGDVLLEIDSRDYAASLAQARAKVAGTQATLNQATADVARYQALAAKDEVPRQILDHATAAGELASSGLAAAKAELQQAELNMSYTKILAPQDGRIARKEVEAGAFVGVGQSLFAIVPDETWVVANFKETQLKHMRPGQKAEIKVDAYGLKLEGHVDSIQSGTGATFSLLPPENASGNFVKVVQRVPVKIVLENSADAPGVRADMARIVPGLSVEADVEAK